MTIETKGTIELKDITAVEFICKGCGTVTIRKLNSDLKIPCACGNCDAVWLPNQGDAGQGLRRFLLQIAYYGSGESPYSLRLHVEGLDKVVRAGPVTATPT